MSRRVEKQYHFLYKTICKITENYYYGIHSTNNLDDGYLGSGKRLRYSIRKYGRENHICEKLEFFDTRKELSKKEEEIVNLNEISKKNCLNINIGGDKGSSEIAKIAGDLHSFRLKHDREYRNMVSEKISAGVKKTYDNGRLGKNYFSWKGKKFPEEAKKKIGLKNSARQKGTGNSQYGTCWITNGIENKKIYRGDNIPEGWRLGRKIKKI